MTTSRRRRLGPYPFLTKLVSTLLTVWVIGQSALAKVYYVSSAYTGRDSDGSSLTPFKRLIDAFAKANPGDTIRISQGGYTETEMYSYPEFDSRGIKVELWGGGEAIIGSAGPPPDPNLDTDGDGMPDWYENKYGFNLLDPKDAGRDADNDGLTNLQEYQRRSDPSKNDLVGSAPGQFTVDASGSASYTIPITTPPGTAGMQPSVSVNLKSRGGNGIAGMGGSLGAFSVITRCGQTIEQDGRTRGVAFTAEDRFCLDGQRLVLLSGTYGSDGAEYRTEIESFSRVLSHGRSGNGPASFEVWTKSGQILEFGSTDDSRIKVAHDDHVMAWVLKEVRDTKGNYFQYAYGQNRNQGEFWVDHIEYTGNRDVSLLPYVRVNFGYENRIDVISGKIGSYPVTVSRRLSQISTEVDGELVLRYNFKYEIGSATSRSRLASVQICDASNVCFPETRIADWTDGENIPSFEVQSAIDPNSGYRLDENDYAFLQGDIDGDGRTDLIHLANDNYFYIWHNKGDGQFDRVKVPHADVQANQSHFVPGDFNGEGRADFFHVVSGNLAEVWSGSSQGSISITPARVIGSNDSFDQNDSLRYYPGDFDGDGRTDLIHIVANNRAKVFLSSGNSTFTLTNLTSFPYRITENDDNFFPADVDGDGLTDLVHFNPSNDPTADDEYWVWRSKGDGTFALTKHRVPPGVMDKKKSKFQSGDFNGDGRTDFLHYFRSDLCEIWLATGSGDFDRVTLHPSDLATGIDGYNFEGRNGSDFSFHIADYNGDGRTDIIHVFSRSEIVVWRSLGDGRFVAGKVKLNGHNGYDLKGDAEFRFKLGDFNGDGQTDFVHFVNRQEAFIWQRDARLPDLFKSIVDGYGNRIEINYSPLTDSAVYTSGANAKYPIQDLRGPLYVVANSRQSDGIGGMHQIDRKYSDARANLTGRGFLGFETLQTTDTRTHITSLTKFSQDFPFIGRAVNCNSKTETGRLISVSSASWRSRSLHADTKSFFVFSDGAVSSSYEINGDNRSPITTTITQSEFDEFGNPTTVKIDSGDGHKRMIASDYRNNTDRWILGRLTNIAVTADSPNVPSQTRVSALDYTTDGLLNWEEIEPRRAEFTLRTTYGHDAFGNRISAVITGRDIQTRTNTAEFDSRGRFVKTLRNALGHTSAFETDSRFGVPTTLTDPNLLVTRYEYDGFGRMLSESRPNKTRSLTLYRPPDSDGQNISAMYLVRTFVTGNEPITLYFDSLGRVVRARHTGFSGENIFQDAQYDDLGRIATVSNPYVEGREVYRTEYQYDVLGRLTREILPDESKTAIDYDGLKTTITNPLLEERTEFRNSLGQVERILDHNKKPLTVVYDSFGNVLTNTDSQANATIATYDIRDNKRTLKEPGLPPWRYEYNTLGLLVLQEDGKMQTVSMEYDLLGRMEKQVEPEGTIKWTYDQGNKGIGKLFRIEGTDGYLEGHNFDDFGRPERDSVFINGKLFETRYAYDFASRLQLLTYPTGFSVSNLFNANGYLSEVRTFEGGKLLWQASERHPSGMLVREIFGNTLSTTNNYDPRRLWLRSIKTGGLTGVVQDFGYDFDHLGNLKSRADFHQGLTESFDYDELNRMTNSVVLGRDPITYRYDDIGNLKFKSGLGSFQYGGSAKSPYAVETVDNLSDGRFSYDDNGNQVTGVRRSLQYTSFNKPKKIARDGETHTFSYGPDRDRLTHTVLKNGDSNTTIYAFGNFEEVSHPDQKEARHYISAGGGLVAIFIRTTPSTGPPSDRISYVHADHLGSIETISDTSGRPTERFAYDPHGKRLDSAWNSVPPGSLSSSETEHAFTGHLQLDSLDLIHMGGRVYDPVLGRFLNPDICVQSPLNQQSFNRYSYALNNPLSLTDPSGYAFEHLHHMVSGHRGEIETFSAYALTALAAGPAGLNNQWAVQAVAGAVLGGVQSGGSPQAIASAGVRGFISGLEGDVSGLLQRGELLLLNPDSLESDSSNVGFVWQEIKAGIDGYGRFRQEFAPGSKMPPGENGPIAKAVAEEPDGLRYKYDNDPHFRALVDLSNDLDRFEQDLGLAIFGGKIAEGALVAVKWGFRGLFLAEEAAPVLGSKLDFVFGAATGDVHNIQRSQSMLARLKTIGLQDTAEARQYVANVLKKAFTQPGVEQANGRVVRESILIGPNIGAVKMQSIWEGNNLITVILK